MLRLFEGGSLKQVNQTQLGGAGALCTGGGRIYCASERDHVIWQMDSRTLMPGALLAGGPGMRDLMLSPDGNLLYVLCSDGDSVLMLDACAGTPLLLCRAGARPARMALDGGARVLAVAGGRSSSVLLFDAQTLERIAEMPMPGEVCDVELHRGAVYALCMSEPQGSVLVGVFPYGMRRTRGLPGLPGALLAMGNTVAAATEDAVHLLDASELRCRACLRINGRPSRLMAAQARLVCIDQYTQRLLEAKRDGCFSVCAQAEDIAPY